MEMDSLSQSGETERQGKHALQRLNSLCLCENRPRKHVPESNSKDRGKVTHNFESKPQSQGSKRLIFHLCEASVVVFIWVSYSSCDAWLLSSSTLYVSTVSPSPDFTSRD